MAPDPSPAAQGVLLCGLEDAPPFGANPVLPDSGGATLSIKTSISEPVWFCSALKLEITCSSISPISDRFHQVCQSRPPFPLAASPTCR